MKIRPTTHLLHSLLLTFFVISGCSPAAKKARILERADRYFKIGQYDSAKIEYKNLLRLDPQNVHAFQQLGLIWWEQGVPLEAVPFLAHVREIAPQNITARAKLAVGLMALGQQAEARKEALSILEKDPANSDAVVLVADTSNGNEEIAASEQQIQKFPDKTSASYHLALASLAIKKGDLGAASEEAQQALTTEPKSARAHLVMGYMYLMRKNSTHAEPELKTAAELAPARSEERIKYAEFQAANNAPDQARETLQAIIKEAPDYVPAWRDLAQIAFTQKKYDEAISFLDNIFSRNPENPEARILEAQAWMGKGDPAKAITILERLNGISILQNNPFIKYHLARAYVMNKNLTQAAALLEQAVSIKPDYVEAILLQAELDLRAGKIPQVLRTIEPLHAKQPELPQARVLLADAYRTLGRLEDAAALFREQIRLMPQSSADHFLLGIVLRQQKKNSEARTEFETTVELSPEAWRAVDQLLEMDLMEKNYDAARQHAQQYGEKNPTSAPAHYMLGKIEAAQQHWPAAESELRKAIDIEPSFGLAYDRLLSVYVAQRKLPQAIAELEAGLKKQQDDPRILMTLALLYEQTKDYAKARDDYEKVIAIKPDMVAALNNLAYIYTERLPELDRAYELAQKARTLQGDAPSIGDTLGWVLFKRGDYQQALITLQESAAKLPENATIQFHLGMAAYMMGQPDLARSAFEKALTLTGDFPEREETERRLASLKTGATAPETHEGTDVLALTRQAEDYEQNGKPAEAADTYEQAFRLNPKLTSTALKLAQLYAGPLQKPDKAMDYARKARAMAPANAQAAIELGPVAAQSGNFAWSYSLLGEVARRHGDDPALLHDLAVASYALGKVPEARQTMERSVDASPASPQTAEAKQFLKLTVLDRPSPEVITEDAEVEEILKMRPDYVPALMTRAAIQWQRKSVKEAIDTYTDVLRNYPDFAPAQKYLAMLYVDLPNETDKAYDFAMKARRTLPDDAELAQVLAEISFQRNDFGYAIQLFEQAAKKQSLGAKDLYYLGLAQLHTKQETQGRETLQQAISAGLPEPFAQEAKKHLAEQQPK